MTTDEIIDLLTLAAGFDRRTVGETDITAWQVISNDCGWTYPHAQRALREHYATSRDMLMPADITHRIAAARKRVRAAFELPEPPRDVLDNPDGRAYTTWVQQQLADHMDRGMHAWADTGTLPTPRPQLEA